MKAVRGRPRRPAPRPRAAPSREAAPGVAARLLIPLGTTIGLLALWELFARTGVLPDEVPPFTDIVSWLVGQLGDPAFWTSVAQTRVAVVRRPHHRRGRRHRARRDASVPCRSCSALLNVPLEFLRPIPAIVYLPLLILVLGSRPQTAILLASLGAFWPLLFQSIYGVRAIDQQAIETGKVFGLSKRQRLWYIMLPSLLPYLATGVRIASSLALIVAVSIELVGGVPGLGADMAAASQNGLYDAMYGLLLVSGILGLLLNAVLERTEKRLLRWHVSHRVVNT